MNKWPVRGVACSNVWRLAVVLVACGVLAASCGESHDGDIALAKARYQDCLSKLGGVTHSEFFGGSTYGYAEFVTPNAVIDIKVVHNGGRRYTVPLHGSDIDALESVGC